MPSPSLAPSTAARCQAFVQALLQWYAVHGRELPWRTSGDPYRIWLSEIILQQTRVAQGQPYYERFVTTYPTVEVLAAASEQEVLRLWQGLGYYTRARNLHACARQVAYAFGGKFPCTAAGLLKLPGIGPYTAAAIASIAFGEAVPVVDGNVYRVLARLWGIDAPIDTPAGRQQFQTLAQQLLPSQEPGHYNEALMDFGALQCTPKQPRCDSCPLQQQCCAYQEGTQLLLPVKAKKVTVRQRYFHYLLLHHNDKLYLRQRGAADIWQGLYDFHLVEGEGGQHHVSFAQLDDPLAGALRTHGASLQVSTTAYRHVLTHQQLHARVFHLRLTDAFVQQQHELLTLQGLLPFSSVAIKALPKPVLVTKILAGELIMDDTVAEENGQLAVCKPQLAL